MELDEFSKLFALVLSQYDVGSIPVSLDRVNVGDMPRLAHRACPVVFLLGADDGAIPAAAPSPGLLNDDDRSLLASYGLELAPRLSDKLYREMTIVYETCALPQRRFYVSWAAAGPDGEERRPSFLQSKLNFLFPQARRVEEGRLDGSFRLAAPRPALELAGRFPQAGAALRALPEYAPWWSGWSGPPGWSGGGSPARRWTPSMGGGCPCPPPGWTSTSPATSPTLCSTA